jgi:hypothetical protein
MEGIVLTGVDLLDPVGRSLREGFFMFWETLWPLILGFTLSGAVQAFVSHEAMQRRMGNHRPMAVARASGYGMISSSCSYAASAMAKSLFVKGADFVASLVFMFASTNLVIELGAVLLVLMGWQFAVSEFVGGVIMIALLASLGGLWLRGKAVVEARTRLQVEARSGHAPPEDTALQNQQWRKKLRSKAGWADAATYTMSDLTMLRASWSLSRSGTRSSSTATDSGRAPRMPSSARLSPSSASSARSATSLWPRRCGRVGSRSEGSSPSSSPTSSHSPCCSSTAVTTEPA